jgi:MutS domain I
MSSVQGATEHWRAMWSSFFYEFNNMGGCDAQHSHPKPFMGRVALAVRGCKWMQSAASLRPFFVPSGPLPESQKQYWKTKAQYRDVVLFFKVGTFYEL